MNDFGFVKPVDRFGERVAAKRASGTAKNDDRLILPSKCPTRLRLALWCNQHAVADEIVRLTGAAPICAEQEWHVAPRSVHRTRNAVRRSALVSHGE